MNHFYINFNFWLAIYRQFMCLEESILPLVSVNTSEGKDISNEKDSDCGEVHLPSEHSLGVELFLLFDFSDEFGLKFDKLFDVLIGNVIFSME